MYKCQKCNKEFDEEHPLWRFIVEFQRCPNTECREKLPNNLLQAFVCNNCNSLKPIEALAKLNPVTKALVFIPRLIPFPSSHMFKLKRVCTQCKPKANFFALFIASFFTLFIYNYFNGGAEQMHCKDAKKSSEKIADLKVPLKVALTNSSRVEFYSGPNSSCPIQKHVHISQNNPYLAVYKSHKGWSKAMYKGDIGWINDEKINVVGEYSKL